MVVVLAAAAYGTNLLVTHLGQNDSVVVFTDLGNTGQGSGDPSVASGAETTTTYGAASTGDDPALSSTTTIMGVGPILNWGEEAVLDGRTIEVEQPVELPERTIEVELPSEARVPDETGALSGSMLRYIVYTVVTITNTGSEPLTCAAAEFNLLGSNSSGSSGSGSSGIGGQEETLAGYEVLDLVTLRPRGIGDKSGALRAEAGRPPGQSAAGEKAPERTCLWLDERMAELAGRRNGR